MNIDNFYPGLKELSIIAFIFFLFNFMPPLAMANELINSQEAKSTSVVYRLYKDFAWEVVFSDPENLKSVFGDFISEQSRPVLERYFDAELASLLLKDANCTRLSKGEECNLNFDPIFASQDPAAADLTIRKLTNEAVVVAFNYPSNGKKVELEYKLKHGVKGWRIVDIFYKSNGGASLKKILQGQQKSR